MVYVSQQNACSLSISSGSFVKENGIIEFKTDNVDLFNFSLTEVEETNWILKASTYDLHHDEVLNEGNIMTEYEEKFSSMGNPICKLIMYRNKE